MNVITRGHSSLPASAGTATITQNDILTIRGEKKQEQKQKEENYYRIERSYGAFHRDIPLPAEVETENINAVFKNGVLSIHIHKKPEAQRKTKRIEIKTA
jgi:HSP20 family protein